MWIRKLDLIPKLCCEIGLGRAQLLVDVWGRKGKTTQTKQQKFQGGDRGGSVAKTLVALAKTQNPHDSL